MADSEESLRPDIQPGAPLPRDLTDHEAAGRHQDHGDARLRHRHRDRRSERGPRLAAAAPGTIRRSWWNADVGVGYFSAAAASTAAYMSRVKRCFVGVCGVFM